MPREQEVILQAQVEEAIVRLEVILQQEFEVHLQIEVTTDRLRDRRTEVRHREVAAEGVLQDQLAVPLEEINR